MTLEIDKITQSEDFKLFYNKNLRFIYENLEPERKKYLHRFFARLVILLAVVILFGICFYLNLINRSLLINENFLRCITLILCISIFYIAKPFSDYRCDTKDKVMRIILSFWGNFDYHWHVSAIDRKDIKKSGLFSSFDEIDADDSFCGIYHDTKIAVTEQTLRAKGGKFDQNVFKGILILLDFKKSFTKKTVVKTKWSLLNFLGDNMFMLFYLGVIFAVCLFIAAYKGGKDGFIILLTIWSIALLVIGVKIFCKNYDADTSKVSKKRSNSSNHSESVILEDARFIKRWNVSASDQVYARVILTPILMENMLKIQKLFHGYSIDFSFFDNKLLIAVHSRKNMFETTSLMLPALDSTKVDEVYDQLRCIFTLIDILVSKN